MSKELSAEALAYIYLRACETFAPQDAFPEAVRIRVLVDSTVASFWDKGAETLGIAQPADSSATELSGAIYAFIKQRLMLNRVLLFSAIEGFGEAMYTSEKDEVIARVAQAIGMVAEADAAITGAVRGL